MVDKDQFTFEDDDDFPAPAQGAREASPDVDLNDDDFPETSLSAAFAEEEHSAEELAQDDPSTIEQGGGSSRTRMLLMILLLVIAGGAGAYYFMDLGGTTPVVPSVVVPAQTSSKVVAVPAQPAAEHAAPAPSDSAAAPVTMAVPPPPPAEPVDQAAAAPLPAGNMADQQAKQEADKSVPDQVAAKPEARPVPLPAAVATPPAAEPAKASMPAPSAKQIEGGAFALDAGSYLLESNRDSLVAKIKKLGYEPLVTPIEATLDMTRLRVGTYGKDEVQEALAFARTVEPGSYSAPAGDRYVVYAGTFLKSGSVAKLSQRFKEEGITVHPEPVQVVRTLSRIRFGSFATSEDAKAAAREVDDAGLKAVVVKSK